MQVSFWDKMNIMCLLAGDIANVLCQKLCGLYKTNIGKFV